MPQVTVYIREDDLDKWKAVEKKSEFIHNALRLDFDKEALIMSPPIVLKGFKPKRWPELKNEPLQSVVLPPIPKELQTSNIKQNDDGTISPKDIEKPSVYNTYRLAEPEKTLATDKFTPKPPDPVMGFPCCRLKKPCKHWTWDNVDAWVNSITGEARET